MKKEEILQALERAKESHLGWIEAVRKLRHGTIDSFRVPVKDSECEFGRWLYEEGVKLRSIFPEIEYMVKLHVDLHDAFYEMYQICFGRTLDKVMTFFRLFRSLPKEKKMQIVQAYKKVLKKSYELQRKLQILRKRVEIVDPKLLDNLER